MYWRMSNIGAIRRSTLESLLDRASYTLEELLADADILSEFRTSNARLLNVLCERQNIARMILYVFGADPSDHASVAPPTLEDSSGNPITEEQYANFVYVSGEILSADTWVMADALMEHTELLSDVWKLLDRPAPITDHNKMCVFYNMTLALIQRKRPEMLQFLKSQPRTVDRIMTHLHSQYITDLVVKFVTLEDEPTVVLSGGAKFVGEFHHEDSAMFYTWNGQPVVAPDLLQSSSDNSNNANASKEHTVLSAEQVSKLNIVDWFSYYGLMRRLIERMDPNIYMSKRSERLVQRSNTTTTTGNNNNGDGNGDSDEITPVDVPTAKRPSVNSINGVVASSKDADAGDNEEDDDEDSMQHKPSSGRDSSPDSDVSPTDLNANESVETSSEDANTPRKVRRMRQPSSPGTMAAAKLKQSASSPPEDQPLAVPPPNASVAEQSTVESETPVVNKKSTESISVQDVEIEVDIDAISQTSQVILDTISMSQGNPELSTNSAYDNLLIRELCSQSNITTLTSCMLLRQVPAEFTSNTTSKEEIKEAQDYLDAITSAILTNGVYIFIELIRRSYNYTTGGSFADENILNQQQQQQQQQQQMLAVDQSSSASPTQQPILTDLEAVLLPIIDRLGEFLDLLSQPRSVFAVTLGSRSNGIVRNTMDNRNDWHPLGFERLRVCELLAELIHCSSLLRLNIVPRRLAPFQLPVEQDSLLSVGHLCKWVLYRCNTVSRVLDLFFEHPWNNFLHAVVYDILHQVCHLDLTVEVNRVLVVSVFKDGKLLDRLLNEVSINEKTAKENKGMRLGLMGHLMLIAEEAARLLESSQSLLENELADVIILPSLTASESINNNSNGNHQNDLDSIIQSPAKLTNPLTESEIEELPSAAEKLGYKWTDFVISMLNPSRAREAQQSASAQASAANSFVLGDLAGPFSGAFGPPVLVTSGSTTLSVDNDLTNEMMLPSHLTSGMILGEGNDSVSDDDEMDSEDGEFSSSSNRSLMMGQREGGYNYFNDHLATTTTHLTTAVHDSATSVTTPGGVIGTTATSLIEGISTSVGRLALADPDTSSSDSDSDDNDGDADLTEINVDGDNNNNDADDDDEEATRNIGSSLNTVGQYGSTIDSASPEARRPSLIERRSMRFRESAAAIVKDSSENVDPHVLARKSFNLFGDGSSGNDGNDVEGSAGTDTTDDMDTSSDDGDSTGGQLGNDDLSPSFYSPNIMTGNIVSQDSMFSSLANPVANNSNSSVNDCDGEPSANDDIDSGNLAGSSGNCSGRKAKTATTEGADDDEAEELEFQATSIKH